MSLRKRVDADLIDLSLKHTLKNWASRSEPPADSKASLLNAALRAPKRASRSRIDKLTGWVSMSISDNFIEIYFESFKKNPQYSLQPGTIGLNFTGGLTVK